MEYVPEQRSTLEERKLLMKIMYFQMKSFIEEIGFMNNFVPVRKIQFMIYLSSYWNKTYLQTMKKR
jgi:hypothetical protein